MKIKHLSEAKIKFSITEDFTESIIEMVESCELSDFKSIKQYMLECLIEDIKAMDEKDIADHIECIIDF